MKHRDEFNWSAPPPSRLPAFKWLWNHETGKALVWEPGGAGDGFPTHDGAALRNWGRDLDIGGGDISGDADWSDDVLIVRVLVGAGIPEAVERAFRRLLPQATIELQD